MPKKKYYTKKHRCKNMKKIRKISFLLIFYLSIMSCLLIFFPIAHAANISDAFGDKFQDFAGPQGAGYVNGGNFLTLLNLIIKLALSFVGVLFLLLCLYGGYKWMTARGNEQEVEDAKKLLTAAVIGLIIILAAYLISAFVVQVVSEKTITPSSN